MPKKKSKRKEIVVTAPHFKSKKDTLLKDTTGVEAFDVFKLCGKIGRRLSGLMIVVGALFSIFSVVSILLSVESMFSNPLFVGVIGSLGAINIFCGFILLAKK